jgi:transcriptional regulator with XRE-family HTH domain
MIAIANQIKKLRELRNFTQEYMAKKLNMTQQNYSKMEIGEVDFPVSRLAQIAEILGVRPEEILTFDERVIFHQNNPTFQDNSIGINYGQAVLREIQSMYESRLAEMRHSFDARVADMQREITRLHSLLEKALTK